MTPTPRTAAGRRMLSNLAPDTRQNYQFGSVALTGSDADLRAAILAIEAEAATGSEGLRAALERLLDAMEQTDKVVQGIAGHCSWSDAEHEAVQQARAALAPAQGGEGAPLEGRVCVCHGDVHTVANWQYVPASPPLTVERLARALERLEHDLTNLLNDERLDKDREVDRLLHTMRQQARAALASGEEGQRG